MKIGLIAPEYNGKTSYLVALYAVLVQDLSSEKGYPLRFSVDKPKQRRWFNEQFSRLIDESLPLVGEDAGTQRFPTKTADKVTNYVISIKDRASSFEEKVTLVDFPGGIIRGTMSDAQSNLYESTMSDLVECDAFIVLLDATRLLSTGRYVAKHALSPSDIEEVVLAAIKRARNGRYTHVGLPIAFCMSKADKIASLYAGEPEVRERAYRRVIELFPAFFERSHRHPVMIASVSLGENIESAPDGDPELGGAFEPFLIEKPFEFCAVFGSLSAMTEHHKSGEEWKQLARREDAKRVDAKGMGPIDTVVEWFKSGAKVGQWPDERWEEQRDISRRLARAQMESADKYSRTITTFLEDLSDPDAASLYSIYFGGRLHRIVDGFKPGKLPLKPLG